MKIVRRAVDPESDLPDTLNPVLRRVFAGRGVLSADQVDHSLARLLPFETLTSIGTAAEMLSNAIRDDLRITFVADFDADGATSCATGIRGLRALGARHLDYVVPNRFEYGYGLTPEIVAVAARQKPDLIVTVDNGSSSIQGVAAARALGIKVLITDHHLPGETLPDADAMVNPNREDDAFPSKHLAGVGVMFYVLLAVRSRLREQNWFSSGRAEPKLADLLTLVALGTVADVVPLDHNNRILVSQGLARMRAGRCQPGILALLKVAGRQHARVASADLGFAVAPRLNAAGRLADMSIGIECLLSDYPQASLAMARRLDELNRERREIGSEMEQQAETILAELNIAADAAPSGVCLYDPQWHQGVIGILAARVKERLHRPVIVFAREDTGELKGSARSLAGVHIRDVLDVVATRQPDLIAKFGGHAMAAGLTIRETDLPRFTRAWQSELETHPELQATDRVCYTDGSLFSDDLCLETAELLRTGSPWGAGFPAPLFDDEFTILERRWIKDKHLKLVLADAGAKRVDAIAFNVANRPLPPKRQRVHLVYRLEVNDYRPSQLRPQLIVEHIEPVAG